MIKYVYLNTLILFFSISGCNAQNSEEQLRTLQYQSELRVPAPTERWYVPQGLIFKSGKPHLAYYSNNPFLLRLIALETMQSELYDLGRLVDTSLIENSYPKDVVLIRGDTVVLLFSESLIGITKTQLLFHERINKQVRGKWPRHTISGFLGVSNLLYDARHNVIFVRLLAADTPWYKKRYYKNEILGAINLDDLNLEILPVYFPDFFLKRYVGDFISCHISPYNDKLIVSFIATEEAFFFDYTTKATEKIKMPKSNLDKVEPKWFKFNRFVPLEDRMDAVVYNRIYDNILEMPDNKGFIRFYANSLEREEGKYKTRFDKTITMMILDNSFDLVDEFYLPENELYNTYHAFIKDNSLYIKNVRKNALDRNFIHFDVFDLSQIK